MERIFQRSILSALCRGLWLGEKRRGNQNWAGSLWNSGKTIAMKMVITALWVIAIIAFVLVFEGFLYAVLLAVALVCGWLLAKKWTRESTETFRRKIACQNKAKKSGMEGGKLYELLELRTWHWGHHGNGVALDILAHGRNELFMGGMARHWSVTAARLGSWSAWRKSRAFPPIE